MDYRLHLVVELNTWAPLGETPGSRAKLEAFLEDRPGITLTLVTRGFLQGALERRAVGCELGQAHVPRRAQGRDRAGGGEDCGAVWRGG